jgi:hypothetical protein
LLRGRELREVRDPGGHATSVLNLQAGERRSFWWRTAKMMMKCTAPAS